MTHPDFSLDQANATRRVAADGLHTNIYPVTASADTLHAAAQVLMDSGTADSDLGVYVLYARLRRDGVDVRVQAVGGDAARGVRLV